MYINVGSITSKIIEVTRNKATEEFVGKIVVRGKLKNGKSFYRISGTDYSLKESEVLEFIDKGIIIRESLTVSDNVILETATDNNGVPSSTAKIRAIEAEENAENERNNPNDITSSGFATSILDNSDWFNSYPKPDFNMEKPKLAGFFDFKERFVSCCAKKVDSIGFKTKEKIINSIKKEKISSE